MGVLDALKKDPLPERVAPFFIQLYESYAQAIAQMGESMQEHEKIFEIYLQHVREQIDNPHAFDLYHQKITEPFNYFQFGIDFIRPLVDKNASHILHLEHVEKMAEQVRKGENAIIFSNHQTEVDPQLFTVALEDSFPEIGEEIIFVAGDRVISDPLAIPFSMGRNLLCIYSKRYIETPPEKKAHKLSHNQKTMRRMQELLNEGGKTIYVAPSGGRDRPDETGEVVVAPFDSQSIEMFRLIGGNAKHPSHFYTLAMATYNILPPPRTIQTELGESRKIKREGIHFSFGAEIDLDQLESAQLPDRHARRIAQAHYLWDVVRSDYQTLQKLMP